MKKWFIALAFACSHGMAHGELKWDRDRVELKPDAMDTFAEAKFGFVNAGKESVTIESLKASCGCTTPSLPKMTFAPGERSEVVARFDLTGRRGLQTKTVNVQIQGQKEPVVLTLAVSIPDMLKINPPLVVWEQGESGKPKTVSLQAMESMPSKVISVVSSESRMTTSLTTIQEGKDYSITVTPDTTLTPSFAALTIQVEVKGQKRSVIAYAQVKGTPAAGNSVAPVTAGMPIVPEVKETPAAGKSIARAGLKWDRDRVEIRPDVMDASAEAKFGFVNASTEPVTIESVQPSFGCIVGGLRKTTFEPGERSEIGARLSFAGRSGVQTGTVVVRIQGQQEPVVLTLVVSIPEILKINPSLVLWEQGDIGKPKTVLLRASESLPIKVTSVVSSDAHFIAELETIREGLEYVIVVTPETTAFPSFSVLTVESEVKGQKRSLRIFAQVKEAQR